MEALDPVYFTELDVRLERHSIDRFPSALNTLLPQYNARWRNPTCEAVDALHLSHDNSHKEHKWCNPLLAPSLPNLVYKLRQSGASPIVVVPRWNGKVWHQALTEMASK
jgi:hypothetical protein